MNKFIINFNYLNFQFFPVILIALLPVSLLVGSAIINGLIIFIDIFFIVSLFKENNIKYLKNKIFYALLLLWLSLLINAFFSDHFNNSIVRAFGFLRFIILIFAIKYYISVNNYFFKKKIFSFWVIVFFVVTIDLIFEIFFGFNTLGYSNPMAGRLSGFLNEELKIGNFYFGFILITLSFIYYNFQKLSLFYLFSAIFIIIAFLIGERSNFIKIFIILSMFILFLDKKSLFKNILFITTILSILSAIIFFNSNYHQRFYEMLVKPIIGDSKISNTLKKSHYGAHYDTALQIFKNNIVFGVGLKNFRHESGKKEYINKEYIFFERRQTTHPHQLHFELLSETGLFGYLSFFIFFTYFLSLNIKKQIKHRNLYQLSGILFLFSSFLPMLPSGSFFTTYGATIFWINFAIIEAFNNPKIEKLKF